MQVQIQKLSPVLVELDVSIDAERVRAELDKAYRAVGRTAKIRGFRPGKAPRQVLVHVFGARVAADVAQRLMDESFPKAASQHQVRAVTPPSLEPQALREDTPFSYKARVEVLPEIGQVKWEGLSVTRPRSDPTDEQVEEELEALRKANSTLEPPEGGRPCRAGDVVTFDFDVFLDGKVVRDAGARDYQVEIGQGALLPEIEAALPGHQPGDTLEVKVTMPVTHPMPKLRGKEATFQLQLKDVKVRVLPQLDDEFAKDLGNFQTLEELRQDTRQRLAAQLARQAEQRLAEQLVVELVKQNPVPVPPSLVQRQAELTAQEILARARREGQSVRGLSPEMQAQVRADAEIKVRAGLLMAEIARSQNIQIGEPEIEQGLQELAEQTGKNLARLRVEYRDAKQRETLVAMILEDKVLDLIEAKATITEAP